VNLQKKFESKTWISDKCHKGHSGKLSGTLAMTGGVAELRSTVNMPIENFKCRHGQGYTIISSSFKGVNSELSYFLAGIMHVEGIPFY
jgi:hypothetical protein